MFIRSFGIAAFAAVALAVSAGAALAQQAVETFSNFRWADESPAECLSAARTATNAAIAGYGLGGMTTQDDTWFVNTGTEDLNLWVYCIADDNTANLDGAAAKRVLVVINVNSGRPNLGRDLRDFLAECMEAGCPARTPPVVGPERIDWSFSATRFRGENAVHHTFICPSLGDAVPGSIWGSNVYTDDSSICAAAVHAGFISTAGGTVTIEIAPGQAAYDGMVRNGIASNPWGAFDGSFRVVAR